MTLHEHGAAEPSEASSAVPSLLRNALTREQERYRMLYAVAPVALMTTDLFGKVVDANAAAGDCFQIEKRFLVGKPVLSYVVPEQRRRVRTWMLDLVRRGAVGTASARMTRRSGVVFDASLTATPFEDEVWWGIVDETAQRQAEESLWELNRELEARAAQRVHELHALYDALPVGIAVVDAGTWHVHGTNRRAAEILRHWDGKLPAFDAGAPRDIWGIGRVLAGETVPREPTRLQTAAGQEIVLARLAAPLHDATGAIVAAVLVFDEVSARDRDVADAEFVENAAHQLRTPITAIAIAAAALEAGAKDEPDERERFIAHIARESDRMARVIDALLGLARIQRGGAGLIVGLVPLGTLLEEIVAETRVRDDVTVVVDCPDDLAAVGEEPMLREAITNVVANAAAHTAAGSIRISARRDAANVVLDVADSGPGISAAVGDRIFERFYRAEEGRRSGAGLGLAIAAAATRANRGTLELVEAAEGATFRFTLPGAKLL
ncbi:MAG: ATP-binding protein [Gaiellaceae bacterium]